MPALPYPDPPLTDGRITLRPWSEPDIPAIVTACQDPLMPRFLTDLPWPYGEDDAGAWLASHHPQMQEGRGVDLAIVDAENRVLGAIGADLRAAQKAASVGYWLTPAARGHGYVSAAVRLLCGWLFDNLDVERIELTTDPTNLASQRVALSCGFRREGSLRGNLRFRRNGQRRDSFLFGLLREDRRSASEPRTRVIWLNGTFGAGKSSAAAELKRRHPDLAVFDPEMIGFVLRETVPIPTGDFQDLPEWREVVAATVLSLVRHQPGPILAPMSILRRPYLLEILTALRGGGAEVTHALLDAPDEVLSARIDGDTEQPDEAIRFRRGKLADYRGAREWLRLSADLVIDTTRLSIVEVADYIEPLLVAQRTS